MGLHSLTFCRVVCHGRFCVFRVFVPVQKEFGIPEFSIKNWSFKTLKRVDIATTVSAIANIDIKEAYFRFYPGALVML
jgi:hypothetical protein